MNNHTHSQNPNQNSHQKYLHQQQEEEEEQEEQEIIEKWEMDKNKVQFKEEVIRLLNNLTFDYSAVNSIFQLIWNLLQFRNDLLMLQNLKSNSINEALINLLQVCNESAYYECILSAQDIHDALMKENERKTLITDVHNTSSVYTTICQALHVASHKRKLNNLGEKDEILNTESGFSKVYGLHYIIQKNKKIIQFTYAINVHQILKELIPTNPISSYKETLFKMKNMIYLNQKAAGKWNPKSLTNSPYLFVMDLEYDGITSRTDIMKIMVLLPRCFHLRDIYEFEAQEGIYLNVGMVTELNGSFKFYITSDRHHKQFPDVIKIDDEIYTTLPKMEDVVGHILKYNEKPVQVIYEKINDKFAEKNIIFNIRTDMITQWTHYTNKIDEQHGILKNQLQEIQPNQEEIEDDNEIQKIIDEEYHHVKNKEPFDDKINLTNKDFMKFSFNYEKKPSHPPSPPISKELLKNKTPSKNNQTKNPKDDSPINFQKIEKELQSIQKSHQIQNEKPSQIKNKIKEDSSIPPPKQDNFFREEEPEEEEKIEPKKDGLENMDYSPKINEEEEFTNLQNIKSDDLQINKEVSSIRLCTDCVRKLEDNEPGDLCSQCLKAREAVSQDKDIDEEQGSLKKRRDSMNKWECPQCLVSNSNRLTCCSLCGYSKNKKQMNSNPKEWICPVCNIRNKIQSENCSVCNAKQPEIKENNEGQNEEAFIEKEEYKEEQLIEEELPIGFDHESFENEEEDKEEINQDNKKEDNPLQADDWICEKCTFLNKLPDYRCQACNQMNEVIFDLVWQQKSLEKKYKEDEELLKKPGTWICKHCNAPNAPYPFCKKCYKSNDEHREKRIVSNSLYGKIDRANKLFEEEKSPISYTSPKSNKKVISMKSDQMNSYTSSIYPFFCENCQKNCVTNMCTSCFRKATPKNKDEKVAATSLIYPYFCDKCNLGNKTDRCIFCYGRTRKRDFYQGKSSAGSEKQITRYFCYHCAEYSDSYLCKKCKRVLTNNTMKKKNDYSPKKNEFRRTYMS